MQGLFSHYVHPAIEQVLQVSDETAGKPGSAARSDFDKKIHIAARFGLPTGYRSEDANIIGAMPGSKTKDILFFFLTN